MISTISRPSISLLPATVRAELAYVARRDRLVNPRGKFDSAGRWYPDADAEGGTPAVRSPSRAWPFSYMVACRTKRWCAQLPAETLDCDAAAGLEAVLAGRAELTQKSLREIAKLEIA
jgi:hypothetical protein